MCVRTEEHYRFLKKCKQKITFVGPLPQLFVAGSLLHEVQDGFSHVRVGQWVGLGVHFSFSLPTNK